ncbi:MAG: PilZ domain-containing protein [Deltaproteobacteria bacterium]|nr:PilZ domain-containing protein [Deltaproteobacteria bacterium]
MAKKTKKTAKKNKKMAKPMRKKPAMKAKGKGKAKASNKKKMLNRRKHRRIEPKNLWVTERNGEYQFSAQVADISEGGIFLKGRLMTSLMMSEMSIPLGDGMALEVTAKPVHDRVRETSYGAGYKFVEMSKNQAKLLKGLLRNLD